MDLICAQGAGVPGVARSLTPAERQVLLNSRRTEPCDTESRALLRAIWRARLWIACDCRTSAGRAPVLYVRRTGPADYALTPMTDRLAHAPQCVFGPGSAGTPRESPSESCRLADVAQRWVQAAKLHVVYPYAGADLLHSQFMSLREAAKTLDLMPGRRLYDYSRTHSDGLPELFWRVLALKPALPNSYPRGVFLSTAPDIDAPSLAATLAHPSASKEALIAQIPSHTVSRPIDVEVTPGPYLVLFAFAPDANQAAVMIHKIFAHPIHSRGLLVPVLGEHERRTLSVLLVIQRELLRTHHVLLVIRKVLPPAALYDRGIAFQLQRLGPNGRPIDSLDILSVDCADRGPREAMELSEMDWRHDRALREHVREQGALYHFVSTHIEGDNPDVIFAKDASAWALSHAGADTGPARSVEAA
jgi:hypothetical protein